MDQSEMLRKIEAHYHTFWNGPAARIDEQISSDFVDEAAPPGAEPGSGQVKQGSAMARSAFPDMVVTVEDSVVGDNVIAVQARWRGTNSGPFMGRPPSGKSVEFRGMVMWRFDAAGKIDRRWTQIDMSAVFKQLE